MEPPESSPAEQPARPTFWEAFRFWLKLGFISFGGPAGQISIMHSEVVEKRKWVGESRFLHALNFCMLLPGPEAQQLATYLGWRLHGIRGGIAAGALFILPSAIILWALSWVYLDYGHITWVASMFQGMQPAVLAIVMSAVIRLGRKSLKNGFLWGLAGMAFVALFVFKLPFAWVVLTAAATGWLGSKVAPNVFAPSTPSQALDEDSFKPSSRSQTLKALGTALGCAVIWWAPLLLIGLSVGWEHLWWQLGLFFSKAAMITFGGAYAVLPYVSQQAVENYQWLTMEQMMSGLALAETTPGPLIMVLQFVGFTAGWQQAGAMNPLVCATVGAAVTTWATFLPSFMMIFTLAPFLERLEKNRGISAALTAVTAAVVGVVLNLTVWFAIHSILPKGNFDWPTLLAAVVLFGCLLRWKLDITIIVALGAAFGLMRAFLPGM